MILIIGKERLEAELAALRAEWKEKMEISLKASAEEVAERLARNSADIERAVSSRVSEVHKAFAIAVADAQSKLGGLREALNQQADRSQEALSQLQIVEQRINDQIANFNTVIAEAENKLVGLGKYLDDHNERLQRSENAHDELAHRVEDATAAWTQRIEQTLDENR